MTCGGEIGKRKGRRGMDMNMHITYMYCDVKNKMDEKWKEGYERSIEGWEYGEGVIGLSPWALHESKRDWQLQIA